MVPIFKINISLIGYQLSKLNFMAVTWIFDRQPKCWIADNSKSNKFPTAKC